MNPALPFRICKALNRFTLLLSRSSTEAEILLLSGIFGVWDSNIENTRQMAGAE